MVFILSVAAVVLSALFLTFVLFPRKWGFSQDTVNMISNVKKHIFYFAVYIGKGFWKLVLSIKGFVPWVRNAISNIRNSEIAEAISFLFEKETQVETQVEMKKESEKTLTPSQKATNLFWSIFDFCANEYKMKHYQGFQMRGTTIKQSKIDFVLSKNLIRYDQAMGICSTTYTHSLFGCVRAAQRHKIIIDTSLIPTSHGDWGEFIDTCIHEIAHACAHDKGEYDDYHTKLWSDINDSLKKEWYKKNSGMENNFIMKAPNLKPEEIYYWHLLCAAGHG